MAESYKTDNIKSKFLIALEEHHGIVSNACKSIDLARSTYYGWLENDPEFKKSVADIQDIAIDFVEGKLFEKINGVSVVNYNSKGEATVYEQPPSDTAIIFYLKTKGKGRGYIEKQEHGFTDNQGNDASPATILFTNGSKPNGD